MSLLRKVFCGLRRFAINCKLISPDDTFLWMFVIIVAPIAGCVLAWRFWGDLRGDESSLISDVQSATLVIGLPAATILALWRSLVSNRQARSMQMQAESAQAQAEIASRNLQNSVYQKGVEMLGSPVIAVRLGGIHTLRRLAEQYPEEHRAAVMRHLCSFVRFPTPDGTILNHPIGAEVFVIREDVQQAIYAIGARSHKTGNLSAEEIYWIDLHGADLRGARLAGLYLSSPGTDAIQSISMGDLSANPLLLTDLSGAQLDGADLRFTDITAVDFSNNGKSPATGLTSGQLSAAIWDSEDPPLLVGVVDHDGNDLQDMIAAFSLG